MNHSLLSHSLHSHVSLPILLLLLVFHQAWAQDLVSVSSANGRALWNETKYPPIRTLAELRRMQTEVGKVDFEVDLQAQLTFSARYWNVFFVQDGELPSMVQCTDAATSILCVQPLGRWLRIRGLVYAGQSEITLVGFELLPEILPVEPLLLDGVPSAQNLPLDRVVEMPCRLLEVLYRYEQSLLFAQVENSLIELQVQSNLSPQQQRAVETQQLAVARGTLSPKLDLTRVANCSIRMMGVDQLKVIDDQVASVGTAPKIKAEGQLLFTDNIGRVLVGSNQGSRLVRSRFAEFLKPGSEVVVWGQTEKSDGSQQLVAHRIEVLREAELPACVPLSVGAWEQAKSLPLRVSLEAVVVEQFEKKGLRYYHMRSANKHFTAIVNEQASPREPFRSGDRIGLIGAPQIDPTVARQANDRLKLYVLKPEDTQFVSAPVNLKLSDVMWAASIGTLLVGIVFSWNWLLRRQVNERTQGLKKLSSHLRMSFDAISEAVLVTDVDRRLSAWNRQFEQLFGESLSESQSIDVPLNLLRNRLADPTQLTPILRAGEAQSAEPVGVTLTLDNPAQVVRAFVSGIVDTDGTYHGHLYTFEDVSEKQRLESELIQAQKMEAVGQLSGGVAHDFNNLLTIVASNLALIKFLDSPASSEYVNAAETAVRRAAELTQQLLDFSRRSNLDIQVVNLNDLVGSVGMLLRRTFDRSISLQIELCSMPLYVRVDVNRIEQVLINICINARDALKGRSGKITLRVSPVDSNGKGEESFARIEIEDNGCGMPREVQSRIFDPFFTTKKPGEGTGLGLSMAQGVIEQLGGRLTCDSTVNVGTCFRIELLTATGSAAKLAKPPSQPTRSAKSLRILLVDDESMVRSAGQALLRGLGHQPSVAGSGQEALSMLEAETFDVVLLDLTMPNMSGKEAYVQIHRRWPHIPVAICTGYHVDLQTWNNDCDIEAPRIISKPYSVESLSNYLHSLA